MTPTLAIALVMVVLFSSALLLRQYAAWRETPEEKRLRELDPLPDDWVSKR